MFKGSAIGAVGAAIAIFTFAVRAESQTPELLIFGGNDHKEFLGCLNCSETSSSSIWNSSSEYGWQNDYGKWGPYGQFGSQYGAHSACNEYASDAPVIVDRGGAYYGRLSVNQYAQGSICGVSGVDNLCQALKVGVRGDLALLAVRARRGSAILPAEKSAPPSQPQGLSSMTFDQLMARQERSSGSRDRM